MSDLLIGIDIGGTKCAVILGNTVLEILSPPNFPGWDNIPIVNILEEKFGIPVVIQNDANACALAE